MRTKKGGKRRGSPPLVVALVALLGYVIRPIRHDLDALAEKVRPMVGGFNR